MQTDTPKKVKDRLRDYRESHNLTQKELAKRLDLAQTTYSNYENRDTIPPADILVALSHFGVDLNWLLTGTGEMEGAPDGIVQHSHGLKPSPKSISGILSVRKEETVAELEELGIELHPIAKVRVEADAGHGIEVHPEDELEEVAEWVPERYIRRRYNVAPWRVKRLMVRGDSMKPTLNAGQEVRIALWQGEPLWDGRVYVLNSPFGVIIKRLRLRIDHLIIHSDNPEEKDQQVNGEEFEEHYRVIAWLLEKVEPL